MPAQSLTPEPLRGCGCSANPPTGPWASGDLQSTGGGTCANARQYTAYGFTYSSDASVCSQNCIELPLKSGKTLSIGWARLSR